MSSVIFKRTRSIRNSLWHGSSDDLRVLIEDSDYARASSIGKVLSDSGYESVICNGPEDLLRTHCPLVEEGRCSAVSLANIIIFGFDLEKSQSQDILLALQVRARATPIIVLLGEHPTSSESLISEEFLALAPPFTRQRVVAALDQAKAKMQE